MSSSEQRRELYRFGQPESRGLLGSLRAPQLLVLVLGVVVTLVVMRVVPPVAGPLAFAPALLALVVAFVPVGGLVAVDWAMLALTHLTQRFTGSARFRSRLHRDGIVVGPRDDTGPLELPSCWGSWRIVAVEIGPGQAVGVLVDERARTVSATLLARSRVDELLSEAGQELRVAAWGEILASLARESRRIRRFGWVERTVPAEVDEIAAFLKERSPGQLMLADGPLAAYMGLINESSRLALEHEAFITVEITHRHRRRGGLDALGREVVEELRLVAHAIEDTGLARVGALPPRLLAAAVRHGLDPSSRARLAGLAANGAAEGCAPAAAGPVAIDERWASLQLDSTFTRTFRVVRWPQRDVGALFLTPLLARTQAQRAMSVVCEPVAPSRAWRQAEAAVTGQEGDARTRERHGFLSTARQTRRRVDAEERERELTDGHQAFRFAGHITVYATSEEELERSCAEVVQAAMHAGLELQPLYAQQQEALVRTLPGFCRGLD